MAGSLEPLGATGVPATIAPAVTGTAAARSAAEPAAPVLLRLGLVDRERPAVVLLPVEGRDRRLRLRVAAHLDEPEALAPAGVPVLNDLGAGHRAVLGAQLLQVGVGDVVAEVPDV